MYDQICTNTSQPGPSCSATSDKCIHIRPHEHILETSESVPEYSVSPVSKERFDEHERSNDHIDNLKMYQTRLLKQGRVDVELEKEISTAKEYWVKDLERIISVIKFLATRELAFRGTHKELAKNGMETT
ncbi:unnamed protein product [Diabrotica balteata]|uniref:Uncharacterized protein n=1 Tax=Diabrotica balteata TaxID=107213 RepID=A0A9N9SZ00_DIABA|nr:unnamed protein product [Diabrotica balteata]